MYNNTLRTYVCMYDVGYIITTLKVKLSLAGSFQKLVVATYIANKSLWVYPCDVDVYTASIIMHARFVYCT